MASSDSIREDMTTHTAFLKRMRTFAKSSVALVLAVCLFNSLQAQTSPKTESSESADQIGLDDPRGTPSSLPSSQGEFFGIDRIWDVHITVADEEWSGMQPSKVGYGRGRFPYVQSRVSIAGHDEIEVGLRFKGQSTYWKVPRENWKRSFKLDFDRYVEDGRFLDLKKLNLNNNYFDSTQVREAISYQAYRDASVPAARTAFARVHLTIEKQVEKNGRGEGEIKDVYLGLYTMVEQQDVAFLKRHTGEKGVLLKPEKQVLPYLGDQWDLRYEEFYAPRTKVSPTAGQVIVNLARLQKDYRQGWYREGDIKDSKTRKNNQQDFQTRLESVLDIDEFLRYLAVTTLIGNGDSPILMFPHNYYLAIPAKSRRVLWLPWDLNNSIGGMGRLFGVRFEELSIYHVSDVPLLKRILQVPAYRQRYTKIVRELIEGPCSAASLTAVYQMAKRTTKIAMAEEAQYPAIVTRFSSMKTGRNKKPGGQKKLSGKLGGKIAGPLDLGQFFRARETSVLDELAGRSQAVRPTRSGKFSGTKAKRFGK